MDNGTIELAKISGIYAIINKQSNMVYIGQSLDVKRRWKEHIEQLRNGTHHNYLLLQDYHKYGEDSFEFKLLQQHILSNHIKTVCDLLILENEYIKLYSQNYRLYNIEDTLESILNHAQPIILDRPKYSIIIKRNLIKRLVTTDIIWIENTPCIVELPNIDQYIKRKLSQAKAFYLKSIIPNEIKLQCLLIRELSYVDTHNTKKTVIGMLVKEEYPLVDWLIKNRYTDNKHIDETMRKLHGEKL